jgi:hypothetical protein
MAVSATAYPSIATAAWKWVYTNSENRPNVIAPLPLWTDFHCEFRCWCKSTHRYCDLGSMAGRWRCARPGARCRF